MFFEPPPAERDPVGRSRPDAPSWSNPPELELGSVLAVERIVARSSNVVIVLPTIRAFGTGCLLNIEVVGRQGALSADGMIPEAGPETARRALASIDPEVAAAKLDLAAVYTNEFVKKANAKFAKS